MAYTTDQQIDALMREWNRGTTDTTDRAVLLAYIKQVEREEWARHDWWFKKDVTTVSFVQGTQQYDFAATVADVETMFDGNGARMSKVPQRTFDRVFRGTAVTGTPSTWCVDQMIQATDVIRVRVAPIPDANATGAARIEVRSNADSLTDAGSSVSAFPLEARGLIDNRVQFRMALHVKDQLRAEAFKQRGDEAEQRLIQEDMRRKAAA